MNKEQLMQKKDALLAELADRMLPYYAHMHEGDTEGMEMAVQGIVAHLAKNMPNLAKVSADTFGGDALKCPKPQSARTASGSPWASRATASRLITSAAMTA